MTKREMEQLIDERVVELKAEVDKKYKEEKDKIEKKHKDLVTVLKQTIQDKAKELNLVLDQYHFRCIVESYNYTDEYKEVMAKINKERNKIDEDAKELKKRLVIMGLKNKEVASILMQYLGMEEK